jgi:curved DNA-binding protein CbpA
MANPRILGQAGKRRSTRVAAGVSMNVRGLDANGQAFVERRVTLEVSFQGCKYYSRYDLPKDTVLTVEIPGARKTSGMEQYRARVAWLHRSPQLRGLFQVGVEFETPGNFWGIANPPEDWRQAEAPKARADSAFELEMKEMLALAESGTYYQLLHMTADSPRGEARQNYYKLVRKFHPDRHMDHVEWLPPLHRLMEAVTVAYKTLTDDLARRKYDQKLAASSAYTLGQRPSDVQKTAGECLEKARECFKAQNSGGTILWLRKAVEMEPNSSKYHALLAKALSAVPPLRREAVEHFEMAVELDPWNSAARVQLGGLYEGLKLPWRARPHYQKALEIDADNQKAQERLRAIDGESGEKKRAILDRIFHPSSK